MTQEEIIRMALEAGGVIYEVDYCFEIQNLERFAALIAAAEREACAKVCETQVETGAHLRCAAALRARGEK